MAHLQEERPYQVQRVIFERPELDSRSEYTNDARTKIR